jgi:hypothetical protein
VRPQGSPGQYGTVAYDSATGAELWNARYGVGAGLSRAEDIAVSPDGTRVFVAGTSDDEAGSTEAATVAYDTATGAQLWAARYDSGLPGDTDAAATLAVSPDGGTVYAGGHAFESFALSHALTLAYDTRTGRQLWVDLYAAPGGDWNRANDIVVSDRGDRVYVAAAAVGLSTLAYTRDGERVGVTSHGAGGLFAGRSESVEGALSGDDGTFIAVGTLGRTGGSAWTVAAFTTQRQRPPAGRG